MLYRDESLNNPVQEAPYVTDPEGKITIESLKTGTYYLVETKSPEGYQLLANPVKIEVTWEGKVMTVFVDGEKVTSEDGMNQIYIVQKENSTNHKDEVHITIYNSRNFSLPATGGGGVLMIGALLGGILLLIFAMWRMGSKER